MLAAPALKPIPLPEPIRTQLATLVINKQLELPVLPEVASQVVQLCNRENVDLRELAVVVKRDPSMAGHLMRLANSPLYAPPTPLVSIDQVVSRLGLVKVRELALVISCQSKVFTVKGYEEKVRLQFRHSLAAGLFAGEIARARRLNVEEAFLCGLLHDVGQPVLLQAVVDLANKAGITLERPAVEGACSMLHDRVGGDLVAHWSLPVRLSDAIRWHHQPEKATQAMSQARITALADDLSHLLLGGPKVVTEDAIREHPLLEALNIYPEEMDAILAKAPGFKSQVEAMG
jgi:HD-like signal output (HDOD) protein